MVKITHTHVVTSLGVAIFAAGIVLLVVYVNDTSKSVPEVISGTVNEFAQVAKGNFGTSTPDLSSIVFTDISAVVVTRSVGTSTATTTFPVDLALTPAERTQGLSGRASLKKDTGLFFVFESSDKYGFWMKDMNFSIDILWIDESMKIVHIEPSVSPSTYPKSFVSPVPARFVLELPAGTAKTHKIQMGDSINFLYKNE